jgi:hypothetical protein
MGSKKLSVEEVLANLELRAAFHEKQEAFHAEQEAHHHEERALHAAAREKVLQSLGAFRAVSVAAVDLAQPLAEIPGSAAADDGKKEKAEELPPPGRLMVSRLLHLIVESPSLEEPFGPSTVAAEANRRFADRLREPVSPRVASDVLRRLLGQGVVHLAREGKPSSEALYTRKRRLP